MVSPYRVGSHSLMEGAPGQRVDLRLSRLTRPVEERRKQTHDTGATAVQQNQGESPGGIMGGGGLNSGPSAAVEQRVQAPPPSYASVT